jgi:hypothetical protein
MKDPGANLQVDGNLVFELDCEPAIQRTHFYVLAIDRKAQLTSVCYDIAANSFFGGVLRIRQARQPMDVVGEFAVPQVNGSSLHRHKGDRGENRQFDDEPGMAPA